MQRTTDPYEVLGLDRASGEAEVRRRYLELVRRHPPDRDPQRFAEVRAAYEQLKDPVVALDSWLFQAGSEDSLDAIIADVRGRLRTERIPLATLLSLAERG